MAFIKLQFRPGVNRDQTDYSNEGGWYECDKIRFRSGYPEKIGGWTRTPTNVPIVGTCRQMWSWITTFGDDFLAMGTNQKVYIEVAGYLYGITPYRDTVPTISTPNTDSCINTTNTSSVVTFKLGTAHAASDGDYVQISGVASAIGGIPSATLNGNYAITTVGGQPNWFTVDVGTAATSTTTSQGGTTVVLGFEISSGYAINTLGYGWGTGTWSRLAWGLGDPSNPVTQTQRDWWFDNFDNDLVMNIRNGQGYWWERGTTTDPGSALTTHAVRYKTYAVAEGFNGDYVPSKIMQLLVSQQDKHIIALGAVPFGQTSTDYFDPLLIRWADQDTPGDWDESSDVNTAGSLRVSRGSRIIRGLATRQEILVWTDTHLFTLQFLGTTDVFGLQEYADNVSIMSPRSVATAANIVYWMGQDKFYAYTGRVETLPCTLRNHVFNNINISQAGQVICGTNEQWNEIWWFYPTANSDYNDAYVVYNHLEKIWYYGTMERTAWLDTPVRHWPQACNTPSTGTTGYLYSHENGINDDALPMTSYIQSSDFDLDDGEQFILTRRIIPDIGFNESTATTPELTLELRHRNFPGSALQGDAEDNARVIQTAVNQYTSQIFIRARARQMALKIISENLGVQWQLGSPRLDGRADGRR